MTGLGPGVRRPGEAEAVGAAREKVKSQVGADLAAGAGDEDTHSRLICFESGTHQVQMNVHLRLAAPAGIGMNR